MLILLNHNKLEVYTSVLEISVGLGTSQLWQVVWQMVIPIMQSWSWNALSDRVYCVAMCSNVRLHYFVLIIEQGTLFSVCCIVCSVQSELQNDTTVQSIVVLSLDGLGQIYSKLYTIFLSKSVVLYQAPFRGSFGKKLKLQNFFYIPHPKLIDLLAFIWRVMRSFLVYLFWPVPKETIPKVRDGNWKYKKPFL